MNIGVNIELVDPKFIILQTISGTNFKFSFFSFSFFISQLLLYYIDFFLWLFIFTLHFTCIYIYRVRVYYAHTHIYIYIYTYIHFFKFYSIMLCYILFISFFIIQEGTQPSKLLYKLLTITQFT